MIMRWGGRFTATPQEIDHLYALAEDLFITAIERYAARG